jgi:hypothetical protein
LPGFLRWLIRKIHSSSPGATFQREFVRRGAADISFIRITVETIPSGSAMMVNGLPVPIYPIQSVERFDMLEDDAGVQLPRGDGFEAHSQASKLEIVLFGVDVLMNSTVPTFYYIPASDI